MMIVTVSMAVAIVDMALGERIIIIVTFGGVAHLLVSF